jgi:hypothetical protein
VKAAAVVLIMSFIASAAEAQSGGSNAECRSNPHLARARELYDDLQYEEAATTLQRAIEYSSNCRWDLAEIYRLKAFVDAVNGERERCHRDFEIFLALSPDYEMPPDTPPKIRKCFEDAKEVAPSRRTLGLDHEAPRETQPSAPVSIKVKVTDPLRLVDQVKVYFRREGVKVFTVVSARADDNVSIVIPALSVPPDPQGYKMEYVVRAVDRWDGVLGEAGNSRKPLTFAVTPGSTGGSEVLGQWWFWTGLVVAAAAVLGGTLYLANAGGDTTTLTVNVPGEGG